MFGHNTGQSNMLLQVKLSGQLQMKSGGFYRKLLMNVLLKCKTEALFSDVPLM